MAFIDIFRSKKGREEKLRRPPKGALKHSASAKATADKSSKPAKKPEEIEVTAEPEEKKEPATAERSSELASLLISAPHITEKSAGMSEMGAYIFKVSPRANKILVKRAVKELYGFEPVKVRILNMPSKPRFIRGRKGVKSGFKKAIVFLKEGDKIELA